MKFKSFRGKRIDFALIHTCIKPNSRYKLKNVTSNNYIFKLSETSLIYRLSKTSELELVGTCQQNVSL